MLPVRFSKWILPTLCFLVLIMLWEFAALAFGKLIFILPTPSDIFSTIVQNWDRFSFHILITLKEVIVGSFIAFLIAFPTAWLMAEYKMAQLTIQPLFVISQSIPMFAIAPIMVLWFDWSFTAIVIPTALMVFFPLALTLYQGLGSIPLELSEFFRLHKATRWQVFTKLSLPYALPHIFSGLKISAAIAALGAVSAEWTGAQAGLGMLIQESRRNTDLETTFGAIICVVGVSLVLYIFTILLERSFLKAKKKPVKLIYSLVIIAVTLFFTGCQNREQKTEETKILLDWFPNPNHIPLYCGIEKGFFQEENIHLSIQKIFDPADTIPYLSSQKTDLAIYYMPQAIKAKSKGADFKVIGKLIDRPLNCLLFRKDSGIKSTKDLHGKVVGHAMGSLNSLHLKKICATQNVKPRLVLQLATDLVAPLTTGRVDAVLGCCWTIEKEQLQELGIETEHIPISNLGIPHYEELIVIANRDLGLNKEFVSGFQRALQKSIVYCCENPKAAFLLYLKANPDKMLHTQIWEERAWENTYPLFTHEQSFTTDSWKDFSDWMYENGLLGDNIDVEDLKP